MKQLLKVLSNDMKPPIQGGDEYKLKKWYHCDNFDESDTECSCGFYAIPISELIHYHKPYKKTNVASVRVKGKEKIFSASKQRYEYMIIDRILTKAEIIKLCKEAEPELGYKLSEALYPVNPLLLPEAKITDSDIILLKELASIRDSVWASVWASVWDSISDSIWASIRDSVWTSVWASVRASVRDSVRDSIWDSIWAYIGSLFPNIEKWKYVDRYRNQYPFQSCADLWHRGIVPSFDGKLWRLHSGENAKIIWTEPSIDWLKSEASK